MSLKEIFSPIEGIHVRIREISSNDSEMLIAWRNDEERGKFITREKLTIENHNNFLKNYSLRKNDIYCIAETIKRKEALGTVAIHDIDYNHLRGEFGRLFIQEKYKILAFEMAYLMIQFGFECLKLYKIYCQTQKNNKAALRFDKQLCFKEEAILKEHFWNGNKMTDLVFMSLFEKDYFELNREFQTLIDRGYKDLNI